MNSIANSVDLPRLPPRRPDSHKGDFGRALLIGGSQGMAGSIALAGMAALRSGAGLVTIATPVICQPTVAGFEPSYMTLPMPCDAQGRLAVTSQPLLEQAAEVATAVACGPGLGRLDDLTQLVGGMYSKFQQPMVIDADGLNALAQSGGEISHPAGPRVLTPHPGEFARLLNVPRVEAADRQSLAEQFAQRTGAVVILKGHQSIITDGRQSWINGTGNPGMATGGTGDVLTGILIALLCQGLSAIHAARLGAHVHGLAGDMAAAELGQVSLIASDLLRYLPLAWQAV